MLDLGAPGSFDSRQLTKPSVIYDADQHGCPVPHVVRRRGRDRAAASATRPPWTAAPGPRSARCCLPASPAWPTATASCSRASSSTTACTSCGTRPTTPTTAASPTRPPPTASPGRAAGSSSTSARGNYSEGAFAPAVVRTATGFHMLFTGNKIVAGGDIQSKLINADSSDGLTWSAGNIALQRVRQRHGVRRLQRLRSRRSSATRPTPRIRTRCGTSATTPTPTATTTTASGSPTRRTPAPCRSGSRRRARRRPVLRVGAHARHAGRGLRLDEGRRPAAGRQAGCGRARASTASTPAPTPPTSSRASASSSRATAASPGPTSARTRR